MSASTVSVTATSRRRTSSTAAKQSVDILSHDSQIDAADNNKLPSADLSNKDVTQSIRAEASLQPTLPNKPTTSNRNRNTAPTSSSKHPKPKPRWKTILRVILKISMLLAVVLGLVQMVRKLAVMSVAGGDDLLGFGDMEGRISAAESSMKTTAKMLQVQVEVLDKKIEGEVGNLRREVKKRVETEVEGKFSELVAKSEGLETAVEGLKAVSAGFVTKDDVVRMYDEWRGQVGGSEVSLDEIRGLAREVVEKEIEKHAADGLGRVDYALWSGGSRVVKHSEPYVVGKLGWLAPRKEVDGNAHNMLKPSFGEPGMCFALKGSAGFVTIKLRTAIVPEAITLEHVAKSVAYDRSSAPKDCRVFGWLQGHQSLETDMTSESEKIQLLSVFSYDLEKSNAQTFDVIQSARSAVIDTVRFEFSSNHGSEKHTCIYRLRVHGQEGGLAIAAEY